MKKGDDVERQKASLTRLGLFRELAGGPMARILCFHCQEWVQSLVQELDRANWDRLFTWEGKVLIGISLISL